jgi:hypothetical protein
MGVMKQLRLGQQLVMTMLMEQQLWLGHRRMMMWLLRQLMCLGLIQQLMLGLMMEHWSRQQQRLMVMRQQQ